MCGDTEHGFWDTVQACQAQDLVVDRKQLPLLRLFFMSGAAFASPGPDFDAWRQQVRRAAAQYRNRVTKP